MCGLKPCASCASKSKKVSGMRKGKNFLTKEVNLKFSIGHLVVAILGGAGSFVINAGLEKLIDRLPPEAQEYANKGANAAKAGLGAYGAFGMKKVNPYVRALSLGFAVGSGIQLGHQLAPEYVKLEGTGDFYPSAGATTIVELPMSQSGALNGAGGNNLAENDISVFGSGDYGEYMSAI